MLDHQAPGTVVNGAFFYETVDDIIGNRLDDRLGTINGAGGGTRRKVGAQNGADCVWRHKEGSWTAKDTTATPMKTKLQKLECLNIILFGKRKCTREERMHVKNTYPPHALNPQRGFG